MTFYNNILFIHIPKTGGTSVHSYFEKKYNTENVLNIHTEKIYSYFLNDKEKLFANNHSLVHYTFQEITNILKYNCFEKIYSAVRNPYTRIVSRLFFASLINISMNKDEVYNVIKNELDVFNKFNSYSDNHYLQQYKFLINNCGNIDENIIILRTETLTKDMHDNGEILFDLRENQNKNNVDYMEYLNSNSIKLINDVYYYYFLYFNYTMIK